MRSLENNDNESDIDKFDSNNGSYDNNHDNHSNEMIVRTIKQENNE